MKRAVKGKRGTEKEKGEGIKEAGKMRNIEELNEPQHITF